MRTAPGRRLGPLAPTRRPRRLSLAAITVSTIGHGLMGLLFLAAFIWGGWSTPKVYVVNLVPALPAAGVPRAAPAPPAPQARPAPAPRPAPTPAPALPKRPAPEPEPQETRAREPVRLPDTTLPPPRLPPRPAALPRPGEKELPPVGAPSERQLPPLPGRATARAVEPAEPRPAPPPPGGQAAGAPVGSNSLSLDVTDFPHAWYLRQILQKVEERWQRQARTSEPEQKPLVFVEIQRDGSIQPPRIEKSSGNAFYDQAALRAILDAGPFPPLPGDWTRPSLRIIFRFDLRQEQG